MFPINGYFFGPGGSGKLFFCFRQSRSNKASATARRIAQRSVRVRPIEEKTVLELLDLSHINAEYIVTSFATSEERVNLPLEFFATSCG